MAANTDDVPVSEGDLQWNVDNEVHLYHAMIGNKPAGINKHFNMASICERLANYTSKDVTSDCVWRYLGTLYNLEILDEIEGIPFPNDEKDFSLPESEYGNLMKQKAKEIVAKIEEIEDRSVSPRVQNSIKSSIRGAAAKDSTPKSSAKKDTEKVSKSQKDSKDLLLSGNVERSNTPTKATEKDSAKADPRRDSKDSTSSTKETAKTAGNAAKSTPAKETKATKSSRLSNAEKSEDSSKSNDDSASAKRGNKRSTRGSLKSEEPTPPSRRRRI